VLGKIEYVNNEIDQSTGSFIVKAIFDNADEKLWPGMFVNLKIALGTEDNAIVIPEPAIQQGQKNSSYVYIAVNSKAVKKDVVVARTSEGRAVISSGVSEGDMVITDGIQSLTDGADIISNNQEAPKPEKM
jgi:multidrug efflux system membrane fusion protein